MRWAGYFIGTLTALVSLGGCGLAHTIDSDQLLGIGLEHKVRLFDAENDISISVDERDALTSELRDLKGDIVDAEAQIAEAEGDAERARLKGDAKRGEIADMATEVFAMKVDFLEARMDYLRSRRRLQDIYILVAKSRFELEKAKLVAQYNLRGAESLDLADFELQVDDYVARAKAGQEDLASEEQELEVFQKEWLKRRDQLSVASGGGFGSPWAEESALWESR